MHDWLITFSKQEIIPNILTSISTSTTDSAASSGTLEYQAGSSS